MKTLSDLSSLICANTGRTYELPFSTLVNEALNYAAIMAAILFEPEELKAKASSITLSSGVNSISLTSVSFTNLLNITTVYNSSDSTPVWFIPIELWNVIIPSSLTTLKFFTQHGQTAYFKATQGSNKLLDFYYRKYPTPMTEGASQLGFDWHDDYVVAVATGLVFNAIEETESAANWDKAQQAIGSVMAMGGMVRQIVQGRSTKLQQAIQAMKGG